MNKPDNPGVQFPPPFLYAVVFVIGIFLQKFLPLDHAVFGMRAISIAGIVFLVIAFLFMVRSIGLFIRTKNTIVPNKAASSLLTTGIYHFTRNPMYVSLALIYLGLTCLIGNWWNMILLPVLLILVQELIIKREERYLARAFGDAYLQYKLQVRRWL